MELQGALLNLKDSTVKFNTHNLRIFPKILSIYNFQNFHLKKIHLIKNDITIESSDYNYFIKNILNQKKNILFKDSNLKIVDKKKTIIELENVKFTNYGYKNYFVIGNIFNQPFTIQLDETLKNVNFKLPKAGVNTVINLKSNKIGTKKGILKAKILNSNFKLNFDYQEGILNISNFFFRNKNLSFNNESLIIFKPFLDARSIFYIDKFDTSILKKLDLEKLSEKKILLKN